MRIMVKKNRTNITVQDSELWAWAFGRAKQQNHKNVSEYIFNLIEKDKQTTEQKP